MTVSFCGGDSDAMYMPAMLKMRIINNAATWIDVLYSSCLAPLHAGFDDSSPRRLSSALRRDVGMVDHDGAGWWLSYVSIEALGTGNGAYLCLPDHVLP